MLQILIRIFQSYEAGHFAPLRMGQWGAITMELRCLEMMEQTLYSRTQRLQPVELKDTLSLVLHLLMWTPLR